MPPHFPTDVRILGVDPGLNLTGYGVLKISGGVPTVLEAGVIRGKDRESLTSRLHDMHTGLTEVMTAHQPQVMAVEQLYGHYSRPRTAILMGHARGVICLCAAQFDIPLTAYAATQIKKCLTGAGHAPKMQMQYAIQRELRLATLPEPPDVADALAVALCHYYLAVRTQNAKI